MRLFSHKNRPVHLGPYPLERLPRADRDHPALASAAVGPLPITDPHRPESLANSMSQYIDVMDLMRVGQVAPRPLPG